MTKCQNFTGLLTKKFINLLKQAEDGNLDLNKAAETLEVIIKLSDCMHFSILNANLRVSNDTGAKEANI